MPRDSPPDLVEPGSIPNGEQVWVKGEMHQQLYDEGVERTAKIAGLPLRLDRGPSAWTDVG